MIGWEHSVKANRTEKEREVDRDRDTEKVKEKEGKSVGRKRGDEQAILSFSSSIYSIHIIQLVIPAASEGSLDFLAVLPVGSIFSMWL